MYVEQKRTAGPSLEKSDKRRHRFIAAEMAETCFRLAGEPADTNMRAEEDGRLCRLCFCFPIVKKQRRRRQALDECAVNARFCDAR